MHLRDQVWFVLLDVIRFLLHTGTVFAPQKIGQPLLQLEQWSAQSIHHFIFVICDFAEFSFKIFVNVWLMYCYFSFLPVLILQPKYSITSLVVVTLNNLSVSLILDSIAGSSPTNKQLST